MQPTASLADSLARRETWRLVARLARMVGDVDLAEEIAQDALVAALETWPAAGVPDSPGAWLMATAKNRALDALRKRRSVERLEADLGWHEEAHRRSAVLDAPDAVADDQLRLVFVCCHPSLSREQQVALTLRLVAGLTTNEIARSFLVTEPTVAQRIVRAKRVIVDLAIPYEVPGARELGTRLPGVLQVIYLVFNEGYAAARGEALIRHDLCAEALRLGHGLAALMHDEPEVLALVALMEIQSSRAATRVAPDGEMVILADQDRSLWNKDAIARGLVLLDRATQVGRIGPYVLQAELAACHARAPNDAATDWRRIVQLYTQLAALTPSPIVSLNRAVAVSMADGPAAGLACLDGLAELPSLESYHLLPAVRADLLRRLGRTVEAADEYARAIELATNEREKAFLQRRLDEVKRR